MTASRLNRRHWLTLTSGLAAGVALPGLARAQDWPTKAIRFVVPFAPGGTSEIVARAVAAELTKQLGQTVYVDNKGGGAGLPAMTEVAKAAPDGYTFLMGTPGTQSINQFLYPKMPYDTAKDLVPVSFVVRVPNVLMVTPQLPVKDLKQLIALLKSQPGRFSYGTPGNGTPTQHAASGGPAPSGPPGCSCSC